MLVGIGSAGDGLELQSGGRYLQPNSKRGNNAPLLFRRPQRKVDRLNFEYFDIPPIRGFDNAVADIFNRNQILRKLIFSFRLFSFWRGLLAGCL